MDIFTTRIDDALASKQLKEGSFAPNKEGKLVVFGAFSKKVLSHLAADKKDKFFGINGEKLSQAIALHRPRTPDEKAIFEDNVQYLKKHGFVSITESSAALYREKMRENIKQAWDQSNKDGKFT